MRDLRLVSLLRPTPSHCPETGEYEAKMEPVGAIYISIHLASASRIQQTVRGDEVTHTGDVYKRQGECIPAGCRRREAAGGLLGAIPGESAKGRGRVEPTGQECPGRGKYRKLARTVIGLPLTDDGGTSHQRSSVERGENGVREFAQYLIMLLALLTIQHPATAPHRMEPMAEAIPQMVYAEEYTIVAYCVEQYPHICGGNPTTASGEPVTGSDGRRGLRRAADGDAGLHRGNR